MNKSSERIKNMFNKIALNYDFMNNIISFGLDKTIKKTCIKLLKNPQNVLDLCTGTGDIAGILKKQFNNAEITGVDFSEKMLNIARKKYPEIKFIYADCYQIPFDNGSFDTVTMTYGLRNIENRGLVLKEINRIMQKGGTFLHLDFGEKTFAGKLFEKITPLIAKILRQDEIAYKYLADSKREFICPDILAKEAKAEGFRLILRKDFLFRSITCTIFQKTH